MRCPSCMADDSQVRETRRTADGNLRRRRHCNGCNGKFTTVEVVAPAKHMDIVAVPPGTVASLRTALNALVMGKATR